MFLVIWPSMSILHWIVFLLACLVLLSDTHTRRNFSSPVSPIGSPLLHSRSPQHMSGRMSPSPIWVEFSEVQFLDLIFEKLQFPSNFQNSNFQNSNFQIYFLKLQFPSNFQYSNFRIILKLQFSNLIFKTLIFKISNLFF